MARRILLICPCDAREDGELSVLGVRQVRAVGDALGDAPLDAVYSGPDRAAEQTATSIAERHGLVVRRKPTFGVEADESLERASARVLGTFDAVAKGGPGRTSLVVADGRALQIVVSSLSPSGATGDAPSMTAGGITEVLVEEDRLSVARVNDTAHLGWQLHGVERGSQ